MLMKTKDEHKMCPNCHGRIPKDAEACPYCAQEQSEQYSNETTAQTTLFEHQSLQDSLASLYSPPYPAKRNTIPEPTISKRKKMIPPIQKTGAEPEPFLSANDETNRVEEELSDDDKIDAKGSFWAILLMILGGNLLTLGLMQVFFSEGRSLRLEWNADYWYLYCLAAIPFVFVGLRLANRLK